jgi:hypothetical protein
MVRKVRRKYNSSKHGLSHSKSLRKHSLSHSKSLRKHGISHSKSLRKHGISHSKSLRKHGLSHSKSLRKHGLSHSKSLRKRKRSMRGGVAGDESKDRWNTELTERGVSECTTNKWNKYHKQKENQHKQHFLSVFCPVYCKEDESTKQTTYHTQDGEKTILSSSGWCKNNYSYGWPPRFTS